MCPSGVFPLRLRLGLLLVGRAASRVAAAALAVGVGSMLLLVDGTAAPIARGAEAGAALGERGAWDFDEAVDGAMGVG